MDIDDIDQDPIPLQKDYDDLVRLISEVAIGDGSKELKMARLELLFEEMEIIKAVLEIVQWISDIATGRNGSTEPKEKRLESSIKELDRLKAELGRVRNREVELLGKRTAGSDGTVTALPQRGIGRNH